MENYLSNLRAWLRGFSRFDEIEFKPGWGAEDWGWWLLYFFDYGACVLILAGPVTSVSNYMFSYWRVTGYHFVQAGGPLWGTERCAPWVRIVVPLFWLTLGVIWYVA